MGVRCGNCRGCQQGELNVLETACLRDAEAAAVKDVSACHHPTARSFGVDRRKLTCPSL